ncbi:hypothetical protein CPSG_04421 [Coccidioides posadasii str. Silveira]|uniref:Uncharacterized protein n=1 Tax=Coccidioides posadasii (strain RMSCC 757 / Silveira) TaxID=443226 RepID=E9D482_COCPS|nr:hypothetical protein CPSG_04421 [Coccidioides posadasii str. Silveira]
MAAGFWTVQGLGWAQDCRKPTPAISTTPNESRRGRMEARDEQSEKEEKKGGLGEERRGRMLEQRMPPPVSGVAFRGVCHHAPQGRPATSRALRSA